VGRNTGSDLSGGSVLLGRREMVRIRTEALRRGLWFKVLSGVERSMVNLAIRVVRGCIKGSRLAQLMMGIVAKLTEALENRFVRMVRETGRPLAAKLSRIAVAWGNKSAVLWAGDAAFVQYLAVMYVNSPEPFFS